jgi:hypothetical protein
VASNKLSRVDGQAELPLVTIADPNTVPVEMIQRQKTAAAAFALACQSSGLEDKEVYMSLGIDAGYFSRIKAGTATLQADTLAQFCQVVGNTIYLEWQAFQVGCTLVQIETESERRAKAAEKRAEAAELKVKVLLETFHARASA